jgi:hypothetical protein
MKFDNNFNFIAKNMLLNDRNEGLSKKYRVPQKPKFQTKQKARTRNISDMNLSSITPQNTNT